MWVCVFISKIFEGDHCCMELSMERLCKRFGSKIAVNEISATLRAGVYGLLGANGAGKTTHAYGLQYPETYIRQNPL